MTKLIDLEVWRTDWASFGFGNFYKTYFFTFSRTPEQAIKYFSQVKFSINVGLVLLGTVLFGVVLFKLRSNFWHGSFVFLLNKTESKTNKLKITRKIVPIIAHFFYLKKTKHWLGGRTLLWRGKILGASGELLSSRVLWFIGFYFEGEWCSKLFSLLITGYIISASVFKRQRGSLSSLVNLFYSRLCLLQFFTLLRRLFFKTYSELSFALGSWSSSIISALISDIAMRFSGSFLSIQIVL